MWKGPVEDPGGGAPEPGSSKELTDLQDQFEQQQVLIAQLKEMVRKSEQSSVTQEKVDEYMNTLSRRSAKARKSMGDDSNRKSLDFPASQKISLLRQQVEENKAKFAIRGQNQKGIEEMVSQIQAQLDDSQHMISQSPLNLSLHDTNVGYNENSTSQELYTALLSKEKKIADLITKVQKLETHNIDLQDNLKEKDSVIDARTKAITLMTDSLSRKNKGTLDTLDDTKDQMRKMQQDFITMEAEMKVRQEKLLEDLRSKKYEIAELQDLNTNLQNDNSRLTTEISTLQIKLEAQTKETKSPRASPQRTNKKGPKQKFKKYSPEAETNYEEKLAALQQQLEAAQGQNVELSAKINQLEGKVAELETISSAVEPADELSKLKKQVEEGNKSMIKVKAQHKSKLKELTKKIEVFKKVGDANAEVVKLEAENCRLGQKIAELEEEKGSLQLNMVESDSGKELDEKIQDYVRMLDEKDKIISLLEADITSLKSEIGLLNEKSNAQVTSEISSIQFEEQLESFESEKKQLQSTLEEALKEKRELADKIDVLVAEKIEISTKLDHYMQENIDLVDKLEKLSAEKVSSAESIEIVESLTQQEKLELEAYNQQTLKLSEENIPQNDLNDSVNELTEETSELLQKIELFTVERREVMDKMEALKQENIQLSMQVKEIENNRDVLAETYEQLQSEKEALDTKFQELLKETKASEDVEKLHEEIFGYRQTIEDQKRELESLAATITDLRARLEEKDEDNKSLNNNVIDLNRALSELENDNTNLQSKFSDLEDAKNILKELIEKNQEEFESVSNTEWQHRRQLEEKDDEISKMAKERDNTQQVIANLEAALQEKDTNFHNILGDMKTKYLALQKQLDSNSGDLAECKKPLEGRIEELTQKNKEQLEKMKKIAANLKNKNQAFLELEEKSKMDQEKWEHEAAEKDANVSSLSLQLQDLENEVSNLRGLLEEKTLQFDGLMYDFDAFRSSKVEVEQKNAEIQNVIAELRAKAEKANEMSLQQEMMQTHENQAQAQTNENALEAKIQELEMFIESQDTELVKYKERVNKLEEGISLVEERRLSLERRANDLGAQLDEKSETCEEITIAEDLLEKRLAALIAHDEIIQAKLEDAISENLELTQRNNEFLQLSETLKKKVDQSMEKVKLLEALQSAMEELEAQSDAAKLHLHQLQNELKHAQSECHKSKADLDRNNQDWQLQFDEVLKERNELMVKCEKLEEEIGVVVEKEQNFRDEMEEYKLKLEASLRFEAELEEAKQELQVLKAEKTVEVQKEARSLSSFFDAPAPDDSARKFEEMEANLRELSSKLQEAESGKLRLESDLCALSAALEATKVELDVHKAAENTVNAVIQEAEERVSPKKIAFAFESHQSDDPFDFVNAPIEDKIVGDSAGNTNEELLNKIKTLEFMLYSMEKEKDDALMQCNGLTNELTRLVYQRAENQPLKDLTSLESHIDSRNVTDSTDLREIEFEGVSMSQSDNHGEEVVEEVLKPASAYLCYKPPVGTTDLESQIVPNQEGAAGKDTFGENDDGWGWSPEEAKLEEEHVLQVSTPLDNLKDQITALQTEREAHIEEIKQLQLKSAKLMKKLKEFKLKNEELSKASKKPEGDFFNLDDTIQEELKLQIQQIEKKLKETSNELEKEKSEKTSILKRVDVLTSANERMVEMKEKQDVEVLGWQRNCRDLQEQLGKLEWGDEAPPAGPPKVELAITADSDLGKTIEELNETIKDLTLDNEELQTLLEEQRSLRISAEKSKDLVNERDVLKASLETALVEKKDLEGQISGLVLKLNDVSQKLDSEDKTLAQSVDEKKHLQNQINDLIVKYNEATQKLEIDHNENEALKTSLAESLEEKENLQDQIKDLIVENNESCQRLNEIEAEKEELNNLNQGKDEVIQRLNATILEIEQARNRIVEDVEREKNELFIKAQENSSDEVAGYHQQIQELTFEKATLFAELQEKNIQIESLHESLEAQITALQADLEVQTQSALTLLQTNTFLTESLAVKDQEQSTINEQWQLTVDQRGADVAESWKLHLESRETEFSQTEQLLRKELAELEEKTNALVNENNELRKNVDTEIRNEVDRDSALQSQINERQNAINELNRQLQEKQSEVESLQQDVLERVAETMQQRQQVELLQNDREIVDSLLRKLGEESPPRDSTSIINLLDDYTHKVHEKENECVLLRQQLDLLQANFTQLQDNTNKKEESLAQLSDVSEEYRVQLETLKENQLTLRIQLQESSQTIEELTAQLHQIQNLKDYENENTQNLQQNILEYQQINTNLSGELHEKSKQLETALSQVHHYDTTVREKEAELNRVKLLVEEKEREHDHMTKEAKTALNESLQEIEGLKRRLQENENHSEELLSVRDSTIGGLNEQLQELAVQLSHKIEECATLQVKIVEQDALLDEDAKQLVELRGLIEEQVLKIEEQKKELFQKSVDYDSMIAQMDITPSDHSTSTKRDDLSEPASRAELDLALYMLHQRDVRCEELTVELTQLLEERDTLQLRLSNAIREKEDIGRRNSPGGGESSGSVGGDQAGESVGAGDNLAIKLSELRNMGYRRDKTFVDEQELRQLQQLSIMQQHRDVAAKLPPEAAARLVDASYTLSRDVQSPSKVLLNWLWGRSTPKVNDL